MENVKWSTIIYQIELFEWKFIIALVGNLWAFE